MSGGMYAISRSWFNDLGGYDVGMDVWGAENLETSFRVSNMPNKVCTLHTCISDISDLAIDNALWGWKIGEKLGMEFSYFDP